MDTSALNWNRFRAQNFQSVNKSKISKPSLLQLLDLLEDSEQLSFVLLLGFPITELQTLICWQQGFYRARMRRATQYYEYKGRRSMRSLIKQTGNGKRNRKSEQVYEISYLNREQLG
jgi:hypothetical protein